jgi:hypothetical protein
MHAHLADSFARLHSVAPNGSLLPLYNLPVYCGGFGRQRMFDAIAEAGPNPLYHVDAGNG